MARIKDTRGRPDENSGYVRLLGNKRLGHLISQVHATVIRSGTELEHRLEAATPPSSKCSLEDAVSTARRSTSTGIQVVFSPEIVRKGGAPGIRGDIVVFQHARRQALIIEVKDGDTFDTKKASGERESMSKLAAWLHDATSGYSTGISFCSFNQLQREAIVQGAKGRFSSDEVLTGPELCSILGIDYEAFRSQRQGEQTENLDYFPSEIVAIPEVRSILASKIR